MAEVSENGRGTTQSDETVIPLVANPVSLAFTDDTPRSFRAGLPYTARVSVLYDINPLAMAGIYIYIL